MQEPIAMRAEAKRLFLFVVILQAGILAAADRGKKWHVSVVIGKIAQL